MEKEDETPENEIDRIFKKIEKMQNELDNQLEDIYQKSGVHRKTIEIFFKNPEHLPKSTQIEALEKKEQLLKQLPLKTRKRLGKKTQQSIQAKRGKKTLGDRRGWKRM